MPKIWSNESFYIILPALTSKTCIPLDSSAVKCRLLHRYQHPSVDMSFDFHYLWTWTQNVLEVKSVLSIFLQIPWATNTTWCQSKQQQPHMRLSLALIPHSQVADQAHPNDSEYSKIQAPYLLSLVFGCFWIQFRIFNSSGCEHDLMHPPFWINLHLL